MKTRLQGKLDEVLKRVSNFKSHFLEDRNIPYSDLIVLGLTEFIFVSFP